MKKILLLISLSFLISCKYDTLEVPVDPIARSNFPEEVGKILVNKCATSGCHNSLSRGVAGGLDFSTWDLMFDGGRNGTSVIPYSVDNSYMLYSVNTDSTQGPVLFPTMPYLQAPISPQEYSTLLNWIAAGAPNKDNFIKFSDNPNRKKLYICMQGCDKVAVIDETSKVIMRYIDVGNLPNQIEAPHQVRVSPDGQFWYVVFYSGDVIQKFRTSDDVLIGTANITSSTWNTIVFSNDGNTGYVNGTFSPQITAEVDLVNMTLIATHSLSSPHGGFVTPDNQFLYLTCQTGNFITKVELPTFDDSKIVLVPGQPISTSSGIDPHEIILTPDGSRYMVSCQASNEVRVFQLSNDSLLAVINVGNKPQELALLPSLNKAFVSCTDQIVDANKTGMIYSIDLTTYQLDSIYAGFQPHGLAADDDTKLIYVTNLNYDPNGPAPHHVASCSGRNGNLTIIDATTMTLYRKNLADGSSFQYKCELLPYPYYISLRK